MDTPMVTWKRAQVAIRAGQSKGPQLAGIAFRAACYLLLASHARSRLYGRADGARSGLA